ncbi:GTP pyrophosphokinase family protein [Fructilactobacillus ixorae]|uniref:GTP pyrophosphokinase family protein n=1 Tax=Fructilactobacillus ixorae TaxID=1750535 RepID=A0ABY5C2B0_9LACO|nr:GTP pyrophosphokinase family protein [Fructilactobacillus ixorae]USS92914.1 GTP pyrophosphokinase family protein [Fructilactobacillus ixorae]
MSQNWELLLFPYQQAAKEWKVKLRGIRKEFQLQDEHSPIEFVTSRIKSVASIQEKMKRRNITPERLTEDMEDLCGLRIMCPFLDDVYEVVQLLRRRNDVEIVSERDYVNNEKESGYRSYHIVFRYPLQLVTGQREILVEIQIRTLAMNFWATLEHSLNYKHPDVFPPDVHQRLQAASETAFKLDEEMSQIHHELAAADADEDEAIKDDKGEQ